MLSSKYSRAMWEMGSRGEVALKTSDAGQDQIVSPVVF